MAALKRRIFIENVSPSVDGGRFPAKAIEGDMCAVEADVFRDGHAALNARLLWRARGAETWNEAPMKDDGNDRWRAEFRAERAGGYEFFIRAWSEEDGVRSESEESASHYSLVVDPALARFSSWYEIFVRSQGTDPRKSGTFKDAEARLPDVKAMGFDVVYLAPIHPIGRTARKGPNNRLDAGPGDPGSPWAIGNENGGHTAIEPAIGTLDDFDRFLKAAHDIGIAVAIDFAPHCSPDHPWVKQHPDWFYHRPDGTIKCHENPPYKYEDIYPLNFDSPSQAALYDALRDVFLFWAARGVNVFRIDNPHTKPVAFWEWVIGEVKAKYPRVIFLGEAFTRPKMMKMLSKAGFSQSYTYFIWRNTKYELTEYMTELIDPRMASYFRPNFFTTTPDVLPETLQHGGRAAFVLRAALAATLSPAWGIVSGYELCEAQALPGTVEYADSEKYQIKVRDWNQPGNIRDTLALLNRLRRENPALQTLDNLTFVPNDNEQVLSYVKMTADRSNTLLIAANLDPHGVQEARLQIPLDKIGVSWDAQFEVQDLMNGAISRWEKAVSLRLDPAHTPFQIFLIKR